jgi:hypothetical protein
MFHASHRRLALLLAKPGEGDVLYLVAVGCHHMVGPFSWSHSDVRIHDEGSGSRIVDEGVNFELRCSSVTLVRASAHDAASDFEGFLGETEPAHV